MRRVVPVLALVWPLWACSTDVEVNGQADHAPTDDRPRVAMGEQGLRLKAWLSLVQAREQGVAGLYHAYYDTDSGRPWFVSTLVSAEVLRFHLRGGEVEQAVAVGEALLGWQHDGHGPAGGRLHGAFPSEIAPTDAGWEARYLYDTSDTLHVVQAFLELYDVTGEDRWLRAASQGGVWLRDVMTRGERYGLWLEAYGAPMKAVTDQGNFDNRISVGRVLFWLPTLRLLSARTGDESYREIADAAYGFLAGAQRDEGGFADHYDPGWPPRAYDPSGFRPYGADGSVVADDTLRAGLGAVLSGDYQAGERLADWIPHENGRVPGYVTLATGAPHFPPGNTPYDDVISSALYRALAVRLGRPDAAEADAYVTRLQADNGGWYWGVNAANGAPLNATQSTLVGLWAVADLVPES